MEAQNLKAIQDLKVRMEEIKNENPSDPKLNQLLLLINEDGEEAKKHHDTALAAHSKALAHKKLAEDFEEVVEKAEKRALEEKQQFKKWRELYLSTFKGRKHSK